MRTIFAKPLTTRDFIAASPDRWVNCPVRGRAAIRPVPAGRLGCDMGHCNHSFATPRLGRPMPYDPHFLKGCEYFNACDFFEAHEVWEELWQEYSGPDRKFYQGLIQVAVCLHHFGNGNCRGCKKLYYSSKAYLEPYGPHHHGVDLAKLLSEMEICCRPILESTEEYPKCEIVPDLIPEIHPDPAE